MRVAPRVLAAGAVCAGVLSTAISSCGARTGLPYSGRWSECSVDGPVVPAPIEISVLMDKSHSMDFETSDGTTKWDAVREAIRTFVLDPGSAGIGVSLTFYPRGTDRDAGPPEGCSTEVACPRPGSYCVPSVGCWPSLGTYCFEDSDCDRAGFPGETCHPVGACTTGNPPYCAVDDPDACGGVQGACIAQGGCAGGPQCFSDLYTIPDVQLTVLPGNVGAIVGALAANETASGTPTLPALTGVHETAKARAKAQPGHEVLVLLTTDGFPNECDPDVFAPTLDAAISNLADIATDGAAAGVRTFVVGVFSPDEEEQAQTNLDRIAQAGGSDLALLVSTEDSVVDEFLAALEQVRFDATKCEYALPEDVHDLGALNTMVTVPDGRRQTLPHVDGVSSCDATPDGFYVASDGLERVRRLVLCPAICNGSIGGNVEVRFPCDFQAPGYR